MSALLPQTFFSGSPKRAWQLNPPGRSGWLVRHGHRRDVDCRAANGAVMAERPLARGR